MEKIKTPLIVLSGAYVIAALDGILSLGLSEGVYMLVGLSAVAAVIWLWVVYSQNT